MRIAAVSIKFWHRAAQASLSLSTLSVVFAMIDRVALCPILTMTLAIAIVIVELGRSRAL